MTTLEVFYGTSVDIHDRILGGAPFPPSAGNWNWLGRGTYFWIEDSSRALEWANLKFPGRAAVLRTRIEPVHCLDLTKVAWAEYVARAYGTVVSRYARRGSELPDNTGDDHALDCQVLEEVCAAMRPPFDSIKAVFWEGAPIYPGSALTLRAQLQIVVRDQRIIVGPTETAFQVVGMEEPRGRTR